jgi:hypothetical protein
VTGADDDVAGESDGTATGRSDGRTPLSGRDLHVPHPNRLPPDRPDRAEILAAHERAVAAGDAGYVDPSTGLFVLTAAFLRDRGTCCGRGCRHCPYVQ